ncbi:hypothetical protein GCM10010420_08870 [Streptomyces glaucosporus]|uniref:Uncharacterized protein n=1 Tax=Streptomyces glaucosporus TaxID=284044 RepID=A0ABN3HTU1_9ACTN
MERRDIFFLQVSMRVGVGGIPGGGPLTPVDGEAFLPISHVHVKERTEGTADFHPAYGGNSRTGSGKAPGTAPACADPSPGAAVHAPGDSRAPSVPDRRYARQRIAPEIRGFLWCEPLEEIGEDAERAARPVLRPEDFPNSPKACGTCPRRGRRTARSPV